MLEKFDKLFTFRDLEAYWTLLAPYMRQCKEILLKMLCQLSVFFDLFMLNISPQGFEM